MIKVAGFCFVVSVMLCGLLYRSPAPCVESHQVYHPAQETWMPNIALYVATGVPVLEPVYTPAYWETVCDRIADDTVR